jgi:hypothetical protein
MGLGAPCPHIYPGRRGVSPLTSGGTAGVPGKDGGGRMNALSKSQRASLKFIVDGGGEDPNRARESRS